MFMSEGDSGFQRGRREAHELRNKNDMLAKREANEARFVRNRLEKVASIGPRADIVGHLNRVSQNDKVFQRNVSDILHGFRKAAAERSAGDDDARDERFVTPLIEGRTYERVRDAAGAMHGARSTEDGWNVGPIIGPRAG